MKKFLKEDVQRMMKLAGNSRLTESFLAEEEEVETHNKYSISFVQEFMSNYDEEDYLNPEAMKQAMEDHKESMLDNAADDIAPSDDDYLGARYIATRQSKLDRVDSWETDEVTVKSVPNEVESLFNKTFQKVMGEYETDYHAVEQSDGTYNITISFARGEVDDGDVVDSHYGPKGAYVRHY